MRRPAISVIVPTYNRSAYLQLAAASILGQSFDDFELLVVDDCSTDETPSVIDDMLRRDRRVVPLRTETNGGCNRARNFGIDRAQGRFIAFLDDDDLALPDRLESGLAALESAAPTAFVSCRYRFIDADGADLPGSSPEIDFGDDESSADRLFEALYCNWAWLPSSTLMFRSSMLMEHRYPEIRRPDGDSIFVTRMAAHGLHCIRPPEFGALIRRDATYVSMSRDRENLLAARRATLVFLRKWLKDQRITRFDHLHRRAWANQLIREAMHSGGMRGVKLTLQALMRDPANEAVRRHIGERVGRRLVK